jgi:predicted ester cyclase
MNPRDLVIALQDACPDLFFDVQDLQSVSDQVTVRWRMQGTHTCPLFEIAPTGRCVHLEGCSIYRLVDGCPVETRDEVDYTGLMQQLG